METLPAFFKDGMTTNDLFKAVTLTALNLCSVEEPDWKNAAGRLKIFDLYKQVARNRKSKKTVPYDYPAFLEFAVSNHIYSDVIPSKYTPEEIRAAAEFINPAYDLVYDYAGANLLLKRYLCEFGDCIVELPQEIYLTIALLLEQNEPAGRRLAQVKDT